MSRTDAEKIAMLKIVSGETDEDILSTYLAIAEDKVLRRAYPYDSSITTVPEQYEITAINIAAYLIAKIGAEGELIHSENSIYRSYESSDVPDSMLNSVLPLVMPL